MSPWRTSILLGTLLVFSGSVEPLRAQDTGDALIELAKQKFKELTPADEKFFRAVAKGEIADFSQQDALPLWSWEPGAFIARASDFVVNHPANAHLWGQDRGLKADRIHWLCTHETAQKSISHRGIRVRGAQIEGSLDLRFVKGLFPLSFWSCKFNQSIDLLNSNFTELSFNGSHTKLIFCEGMKVTASVFMNNGFQAQGGVSFNNASIGHNLDCDGGRFVNVKDYALLATVTKIGGAVLMRNNFQAEGEVRFHNATVGGSFECDGAKFNNPGKNKTALQCFGSSFAGAVHLRTTNKHGKFHAQGKVSLKNAAIGLDLVCTGGKFENLEMEDGKIVARYRAVDLEGVNVKGTLQLSGSFSAAGDVNLFGATIGRNLECNGGQFNQPDGTAFHGDLLKVGGSLYMSTNFKAFGKVRLIGATIGTDFDCAKGQFINEPQEKKSNKDKKDQDKVPFLALEADGLKVGRNIFFREGFFAKGQVRLLNASAGGDLDCSRGSFDGLGNVSLLAERLQVDGTVFCRNGFTAKGEVSFWDANIRGAFEWTTSPPLGETSLDLRSARIGKLRVDRKSFPNTKQIQLNGLTFDELFHLDHFNDKAREEKRKDMIHWVRLQNGYFPQPYEQLASVFRKGGYDDDAREILIAKNDDPAYLAQMGTLERCWHWFLSLIGYGYKPLKLLIPVGVLLVFGWIVFSTGFATGFLSQDKKNDQKPAPPLTWFNVLLYGLVYSAEKCVPFADLELAKTWVIDVNHIENWPRVSFAIHGHYFLYYLWIHKVLGAVGLFFLGAGLSGLVQK